MRDPIDIDFGFAPVKREGAEVFPGIPPKPSCTKPWIVRITDSPRAVIARQLEVLANRIHKNPWTGV